MKRQQLIIYPNCSRGGVTSVIRARAVANPEVQFQAIFFRDHGGRGSFDGVPNLSLRIVREDRAKFYLEYLTSMAEYDEIRVLSQPTIANHLSKNDSNAIIYEFHSSDMGVVESELKQLDLDRLAEIVVPSEDMASQISPRLKPRLRARLRVEENLIDTQNFNSVLEPRFFPELQSGREMAKKPVVWVGRFDKGKGVAYLPRLIAKLPNKYEAHVVLSLENAPGRAGEFLYECDAMGVRDRVKLYMNLAPAEIADLYRSAAAAGGWYVSTSLLESFGYAVREAQACGLRVAAFELPVFEDLYGPDMIHAPVGDVMGLAEQILAKN